ncbi:phosphate metabolism protein 8-like isoform X2 [Primulina eburnea]|uniref:phosphate metabolism protein 8-like isoform X2 n=1 Tax=Primulina eburnea TaxID=1245227 RepID=UPI003C6C0512
MDSSLNSVLGSVSLFDCLLFDLDDTLYSSHTGIGKALKQNVQDFLVEKCGFPESEAVNVNREFFRTYGSSLAGLRASGYDINPDEYHSYVHGRLPYDSIKPNILLRNILETIKQRKMIFTNSDRAHAMNALDRLGIRDCFEKIICFETMNPDISTSRRPEEFPVLLKPSMQAFRIAIDAAGIEPRRMVGQAIKSKEADYALETITNMVKLIPEIWQKEESDKRIVPTRSEMDLVVGA